MLWDKRTVHVRLNGWVVLLAGLLALYSGLLIIALTTHLLASGSHHIM
jgi:hypothetical protein